jgi:hypothetical protein
MVQRQPQEEEEEQLQTKELPAQTSEVTPNLESRINALKGGGQPLHTSTCSFFEPRFGYDFGQVRVHTDVEADTLNSSLNAHAFTTGQDIFFRQGEYNPGSSSGRELLAHELTHVVQQNGDNVQHKFTVGQPGDVHEQKTDAIARQVVQRQEALTANQKPRQALNFTPFSAQQMFQRQETSFPVDSEEKLKEENQVQRKSEIHSVLTPVLQQKLNALDYKTIQRRGGTTVGQLDINSNVISAGLTAGHAWLAYTPTGGTMTTYGTWGNRKPIGLHRDLELGYTPAATRTTALDAGDYTALTGFASANNDWGYINNCASFAARGWRTVTGESLSHTSLRVPNPSALGAGIVAANGGTTGTLVATPPKPSSSSWF